MPAETAQNLRGCWIESRGKEATTFRWFPDRENPAVFAGEQIDYTPLNVKATEDTAWRIDKNLGAPRLCLAGRRAKQILCWRLSFSAEDLPKNGRTAAIRANNETLVIALSDGYGERVLFNGVRDGCD